MCEPGSPAKRYGGVHTGGEYSIQNDQLSSAWLSPASVQPAGRRRSLLPTLLTRRPQSAAPAPAPAAVLPPGRRRASWSSSPPRPCLRTDRPAPGHCRLPRGGPASAATAKRRLKSAAEATMATRTSSLPSEATITETTWRPITPRLAQSTVPPSASRLAEARSRSSPRLTWRHDRGQQFFHP